MIRNAEGQEDKLQDIWKKYARQISYPQDILMNWPESLLQRALRAGHPQSFQAIRTIAEKDPDAWAELLNMKNTTDGNTILHDLAEAVKTHCDDSGQLPQNKQWIAGLLEELASHKDMDILAKNKAGKTAGDLAPSIKIPGFFGARSDKDWLDTPALADDLDLFSAKTPHDWLKKQEGRLKDEISNNALYEREDRDIADRVDVARDKLGKGLRLRDQELRLRDALQEQRPAQFLQKLLKAAEMERSADDGTPTR